MNKLILVIGVAMLPLFLFSQVSSNGMVYLYTNTYEVKVSETAEVFSERTSFILNLHMSTLEIKSENGDKEVIPLKEIKMDENAVWYLTSDVERIYVLNVKLNQVFISASEGAGHSKYY